jgi:hypothetical protein
VRNIGQRRVRMKEQERRRGVHYLFGVLGSEELPRLKSLKDIGLRGPLSM